MENLEEENLGPSCSSTTSTTAATEALGTTTEDMRLKQQRSSSRATEHDIVDGNHHDDEHITMRRLRLVKNSRTRRRTTPDSSMDCYEENPPSQKTSINYSWISKKSSMTSLMLLLLFAFVQPCASIVEKRCGPIDIRNRPWDIKPQWSKLGDPNEKDLAGQRMVNCTVVEGSLTISFVLKHKTKAQEEMHRSLQPRYSQDEFITFPHLREITGTLLVFETEGLVDLRKIFPNLRVIGGRSLIQHYALIIYRNPDLEIGLDKLSVIRNGGVRIIDNRKLCYTKTIDWKHLITSSINDVVVDNAAEYAVTETGLMCPRGACEEDKGESKCHYLEEKNQEQGVERVQSCWSNTTCQKSCAYDRLLPTKEIGPGCDANGDRCHDQCVGGCERVNDATACHACKNVYHKGKCIEKCDAHLYLLLQRRCVTREQCLQLNPVLSNKTVPIKATAGLCSDKCPDGYQINPDDHRECRKCVGKCEIVCEINHVIDTFPKAQAIRLCNIIDGNLTIEIRGKQDSGMASELKDIFANIHTITGYLLVRQSSPFISLNMFRNLRRIEAKSLFRNLYAITVFENPNLKKLFDSTTDLTLDRGTVSIANNKMLCFKYIKQLMSKLNIPLDPIDQSEGTNGEKAICEDMAINVSITAVNADSVFFSWPSFNITDIDQRKFLGYELFFKEVPRIDENMTIEEDRSACVDSWQSVFKQYYETSNGEPTPDIFMDIGPRERIRPNTLYAYYVATQMVLHAGAKNGVSKIGFVRTSYYTPDPPTLALAQVDSDAIHITWEAPLQPNGDLTHYTIMWRENEVSPYEEAEKFCTDASTPANRQHTKDPKETIVADKPVDIPSSRTVAPTLLTMMGHEDQQKTCAATPGCCSCSAIEESSEQNKKKRPDPMSAIESSAFENKLLDEVLMPRDTMRVRRSIEDANRVSEELEKAENLGKAPKTLGGKKPLIHITKKKPSSSSTTSTPAPTIASMYALTRKPTTVPGTRIRLYEIYEPLPGSWAINVSALALDNSYVIRNLKHYTLYAISLSACQNMTVPGASCSISHRAGALKRTKHITDIDKVLNETIEWRFMNNSQQVNVTWDPPTEVNGGIFGYVVKLKSKVDGSIVMTRCVGAKRGYSTRNQGVLFQNLADGRYFVSVTATSVHGAGPEAESSDPIVVMTPGFFTVEIILGMLLVFLILMSIAGCIIYYYIQVRYGKKVKALSDFMQLNPEYCVDNKYNADDWELRQDDVVLGQQCGEGSFGKVYLGTGNNVVSLMGDRFGPCAIKINVDDPASTENLNYLMEANIMKNFKTNFIVKLYGVISTVQPAMVVMEMMDLGNLRDYLRSKREDEVFNETDCNFFDIIPRDKFHEWAAQICDGMAYLESLKFCHRDLAARNCMINRDETVKIGDFGMARDLFYHDYYKPSGKRMMPVRWMSPESLKDGKFDSKSDVWSFGVVLYEMVTLGAQPYIGLSNDEVLNYIGMARKVIKKPECCENYWYKVMKMCWRYSPRDRPTFLQLVHLLAAEASPEFRDLSFVLTDNQMILDDSEALDLDDIDDTDMNDQVVEVAPDVENVEVQSDSERRNTDSIPLKQFKTIPPINATTSHSTISIDETPMKAKQREGSLDEEYALMNHSGGPSDAEVRTYAGDGDYVERDVRENDVPTRRNTGASTSSYTGGGPYCLTNRGGSNERGAGFGEAVRLTDGVGSGHLNDDDYVEKEISSMDTRRSTGASSSSYGVPQTNWSGNRGATYYTSKAQQAATAAAAAAAALQQQQNGGRGDRLTQLPGTGHLQSTRGGQDGDYIETEPKNYRNNGSPSRNGNSRDIFNGRSAFGENEHLIEDNEHHPLV